MFAKKRYLDKKIIDNCLKDIAKFLKKKMKNNHYVELVLVGGASVLLNYNFRNATTDIDCIDTSGLLMNELINKLKEKYELEIDWINTDFLKSKSYSPKLIEVSKFYKSYGNGKLSIRTIKDEYLIAMKIVSGRRYKNDYSDILGIINDMFEREMPLNKDIIDDAIKYLYNTLDVVDKDAYSFAIDMLDPKIRKEYVDVIKIEHSNKEKLDKMFENHKVDKELLDKIK